MAAAWAPLEQHAVQSKALHKFCRVLQQYSAPRGQSLCCFLLVLLCRWLVSLSSAFATTSLLQVQKTIVMRHLQQTGTTSPRCLHRTACTVKNTRPFHASFFGQVLLDRFTKGVEKGQLLGWGWLRVVVCDVFIFCAAFRNLKHHEVVLGGM